MSALNFEEERRAIVSRGGIELRYQIVKNLYCGVSAISEIHFFKSQLQLWKDSNHLLVQTEMKRSPLLLWFCF